MAYIITRQARIDGSYIVEITYDKLAINSDILRSDYKGESELYTDPQSAAETAILIRGTWQHDEPHKNITMALGSAAGYHPMNADELRRWADKEIECMPRCTWCGDTIYSNAVQYVPRGEAHASLFCSMWCVMEFEDDINTPTPDKVAGAVDEAINASEAADRELDHAEQVAGRDIEFQDENRQNV